MKDPCGFAKAARNITKEAADAADVVFDSAKKFGQGPAKNYLSMKGNVIPGINVANILDDVPLARAGTGVSKILDNAPKNPTLPKGKGFFTLDPSSLKNSKMIRFGGPLALGSALTLGGTSLYNNFFRDPTNEEMLTKYKDLGKDQSTIGSQMGEIEGKFRENIKDSESALESARKQFSQFFMPDEKSTLPDSVKNVMSGKQPAAPAGNTQASQAAALNHLKANPNEQYIQGVPNWALYAILAYGGYKALGSMFGGR